MTDTHESATAILFSISPSKIWDDYRGKYEVRPKSVVFTLECSLDGGKTWGRPAVADPLARPKPDADDGKTVYTSVSPEMTITGRAYDETWNGNIWTGLSAYALDGSGKTVAVKYRISESGSNSYYNNGPAYASYAGAENVGVTITNKETKIPTSPKTGDEAHVTFWTVLLTLSGTLLTTAGVYRRKRKN